MGFESQLKRLVLEVLVEGPDHGYGIACRIRRRSKILDGREAVLYASLHDLEGDGDVFSTVKVWKKCQRRHYQISESGLKRLGTVQGSAWPCVGDKPWGRIVPELVKGV